jgi:hypothetical protein
LDRPARFILGHHRSIANARTCAHGADYPANEVPAFALAVDRQIQHREVALAALRRESEGRCAPIPAVHPGTGQLASSTLS